MKFYYLVLFLCTLSFIGCKPEKKKAEVKHQHTEKEVETVVPKKVLSPHTSAMATVGDAHIHIDYSSPGVRGRIIFGGLLPYNEVWQAGAHMATWVETNKDLMIDGNELKAGKYGFFAIPSKGEWILIFNKRWNQHGKDEYDQNEDVLRFKIKPEIMNSITEHLTYVVEETGANEGRITLTWAKIKIQFTVKVK